MTGCRAIRRAGQTVLRAVLAALAECHARGIIHRDVKPSNVLVSEHFDVRLADFGSAVDVRQAHGLYGGDGPSAQDVTAEYAPPEVRFGGVPLDAHRPDAFDLWSVGVLWLELVLGTAQVFNIDDRLRARISAHLEGRDERTREAAYLLAGLQQYCLLEPVHDEEPKQMPSELQMPALVRTSERGTHGTADASERPERADAPWRRWFPACSPTVFADTVRAKDPYHIGITDRMGVQLLKVRRSTGRAAPIAGRRGADRSARPGPAAATLRRGRTHQCVPSTATRLLPQRTR